MGAWIETVLMNQKYQTKHVAPLVGAWIETVTKLNYKKIDLSHPSWVRGLKLKIIRVISFHCLSHPSWVRGLKQE